MNSRHNYVKTLKTSIILFSLIIIMGCEYSQSPEIYPSGSNVPNPSVTTISPDSAVDGVTDITINGSNFSTAVDENFVYFGTTEGIVKEASTDQLIVERPLMISGEFMIQVVVRDAFEPTEYGPYKLEEGVVSVGDPGEYGPITVDRDEIIYAESDRVIYRIEQGQDTVQSEFGTTNFNCLDMKMGPDGYLYLQKKNNRDLFRISPAGGEAERLMRIGGRVTYFDFDEEDFIYAGGEEAGLFSVNLTDQTSLLIPGYEDTLEVLGVRVYDGYVYVMADTITNNPDENFIGIWKHQLGGSGTLVGDKIKIFDFTDVPGWSETIPNGLTFDDNGNILISSDNPNPILVIHRDGSFEPLYPGELTSPSASFCWGTGFYLYYNLQVQSAEDSGIKRVIMGRNGAPYYGRE